MDDLKINLNINEQTNPLFLAITTAITTSKLKFKTEEELDLFIVKFIYNNYKIANRIKFIDKNEEYASSLIDKSNSRN